ncbi:hypothetical protein Syun_013787 [Stephania yunnanensis]|uniref:Uncharacterized protein n=1 Tax=Stephania yunnanensis TaxID=152371 RepID=A0AAP0JI91_9MAGN
MEVSSSANTDAKDMSCVEDGVLDGRRGPAERAGLSTDDIKGLLEGDAAEDANVGDGALTRLLSNIIERSRI